ncbi:MAG TPA: hypothetical protein VGW78_06595 [Candidatus Babeliales bacterium]|jgi:hypothetical protein|nr:hypothetical protein [Candidatus Babeliales bacterium]
MNKKLSILVCALLVISPIVAEYQPKKSMSIRQKAAAYIQQYAKLGQATIAGLLSGICFKRAINSVDASMNARNLRAIHDAKAFEIFKKNLSECYRYAGFMNEQEEMTCRKMAIQEWFQDDKHDSLI